MEKPKLSGLEFRESIFTLKTALTIGRSTGAEAALRFSLNMLASNYDRSFSLAISDYSVILTMLARSLGYTVLLDLKHVLAISKFYHKIECRFPGQFPSKNDIIEQFNKNSKGSDIPRRATPVE